MFLSCLMFFLRFYVHFLSINFLFLEKSPEDGPIWVEMLCGKSIKNEKLNFSWVTVHFSIKGSLQKKTVKVGNPIPIPP